ncbi:UNKNOWN [Stylonychia lemnae]|uniref:Uncharacterized protein n=1 Tax=Stylonychia lemnae TaxID=5949 RepID=A0A077ZZ45_STYLE|nr:UNKNOWN [Stylonychia lemnae]|eukprot:CDW75221.1 UNKNOWN [Stylonychia lemnae]
MDVVQILESLEKFFNLVDSFEFDPKYKDRVLDPRETKDLRINIDKGLRWLIDKIYVEDLEPITLEYDCKIPLNSYPIDVQLAMRDERCTTKLRIKNGNVNDRIFLTPDFLKYFDFSNALDRNYLKSRVRFQSVMINFHAKAFTNRFADKKHQVPFKCNVGNSQWVQSRKNKECVQKLDDQDIQPCPFYAVYERDVDSKTGKGLSPFKLIRYDFTHSHPLSLKYERQFLE